MEELSSGFRWVLGNMDNIVATKDPWLRKSVNLYIGKDPVYDGRHENVSSLFLPN